MRDTERQGEKQAPYKQPDVGLDSGTPGSCPGPKTGTKLLSYPGIPQEALRLFLSLWGIFPLVEWNVCFKKKKKEMFVCLFVCLLAASGLFTWCEDFSHDEFSEYFPLDWTLAHSGCSHMFLSPSKKHFSKFREIILASHGARQRLGFHLQKLLWPSSLTQWGPIHFCLPGLNWHFLHHGFGKDCALYAFRDHPSVLLGLLWETNLEYSLTC